MKCQTSKYVTSEKTTRLILYMIPPKALVRILTMAESSNSSCAIESDDDSFLSGSVNYSTECTDEQSIPNKSVSAEMGCNPIDSYLRCLIVNQQAMMMTIIGILFTL